MQANTCLEWTCSSSVDSPPCCSPRSTHFSGERNRSSVMSLDRGRSKNAASPSLIAVIVTIIVADVLGAVLLALSAFRQGRNRERVFAVSGVLMFCALMLALVTRH